MNSSTTALVLFATSPLLAAQAPVVLVKDADSISGVGLVTSIDNLAVNSNGSWIVEADTDNASSAVDGVLIRDGSVILRQGDAVALPVGAVVSSFDAVVINSAGESGWNLFLTGPPTNADTGLFFGSTLVIQEGSNSTAAGFSPGTPYIGFFETKWNDARQMLVVASMDDPGITGTLERAMIRVAVDGAGSLLSETLLLKRTDPVPGMGGALVVDFGTGPHDFALNNSGVSLYSADTDAATTSDGVILRDTTVIAREGDPAPVAGRFYETLYDRNLDLGDGGDYVFIANLDGTVDDDVIIKNGTTVVVREGDNLPSIGAFTITSFGTGPVRIDAQGNVYWFGDWNDPDTTRDTGIFRNGDLIVQEGVTLTSTGAVISTLASVESSFAISPNGRYLIFEGRLPGTVDAAFLLDTAGLTSAFCFGTGAGTPCPCGNSGAPGNGCANSIVAAGANLGTAGSPSLSADSLTLLGSGMPNSSALYFQGTGQQSGGLGAVFGDGLRCAGGTIVRLGTKTNVLGASQYPAVGDPLVSVRGMVLAPGLRTYQVWYRNAAAFCTVSTFNLSNGMSLTWVP